MFWKIGLFFLEKILFTFLRNGFVIVILNDFAKVKILLFLICNTANINRYNPREGQLAEAAIIFKSVESV